MWTKVIGLLAEGDFANADRLYDNHCSAWWSRLEYSKIRQATAETCFASQVAEIKTRMYEDDFAGADRLYNKHCSTWWPRADYDSSKEPHKISVLEAARFR